MKELTKAEEQIMMILWEIGNGFVNDIIDKTEEPKPAYTTVSTIVRILEKKGFVGHESFGKSHRYFPIVKKKEYTSRFFDGFLNNYFENSFKSLVSFFTRNENMSLEELEEIRKLVEKEIEKRESRDD